MSKTASKHPACETVVVDLSTILHRNFYAVAGESGDPQEVSALTIQSTIYQLQDYYRTFKPTSRYVIATDSTSWRKAYTASPECVSKLLYKGTRRQDMKPDMVRKYSHFVETVAEFVDLLKNHSTLYTLKEPDMEADDLIAAYIQIHAPERIVVVSTDSDLHQLMKHEGVVVYDPIRKKYAMLSDFDGNADFYLFSKCFRGDRQTDNIMSAYPKVRATKLKEAYEDPYVFTELMKHTWSDPDGNVFETEKLYKENRLLIDLEKQPSDIRSRLLSSVEYQIYDEESKFSVPAWTKFLTKQDLPKLISGMSNIIDFYGMRRKR